MARHVVYYGESKHFMPLIQLLQGHQIESIKFSNLLSDVDISYETILAFCAAPSTFKGVQWEDVVAFVLPSAKELYRLWRLHRERASRLPPLQICVTTAQFMSSALQTQQQLPEYFRPGLVLSCALRDRRVAITANAQALFSGTCFEPSFLVQTSGALEITADTLLQSPVTPADKLSSPSSTPTSASLQLRQAKDTAQRLTHLGSAPLVPRNPSKMSLLICLSAADGEIARLRAKYAPALDAQEGQRRIPLPGLDILLLLVSRCAVFSMNSLLELINSCQLMPLRNEQIFMLVTRCAQAAYESSSDSTPSQGVLRIGRPVLPFTYPLEDLTILVSTAVMGQLPVIAAAADALGAVLVRMQRGTSNTEVQLLGSPSTQQASLSDMSSRPITSSQLSFAPLEDVISYSPLEKHNHNPSTMPPTSIQCLLVQEIPRSGDLSLILEQSNTARSFVQTQSAIQRCVLDVNWLCCAAFIQSSAASVAARASSPPLLVPGTMSQALWTPLLRVACSKSRLLPSPWIQHVSLGQSTGYDLICLPDFRAPFWMLRSFPRNMLILSPRFLSRSIPQCVQALLGDGERTGFHLRGPSQADAPTFVPLRTLPLPSALASCTTGVALKSTLLVVLPVSRSAEWFLLYSHLSYRCDCLVIRPLFLPATSTVVDEHVASADAILSFVPAFSPTDFTSEGILQVSPLFLTALAERCRTATQIATAVGEAVALATRDSEFDQTRYSIAVIGHVMGSQPMPCVHDYISSSATRPLPEFSVTMAADE